MATNSTGRKKPYTTPTWDERRKQVIVLREGQKLSFSQIGIAMGISQQRAHALYKSASARREVARRERQQRKAELQKHARA